MEDNSKKTVFEKNPIKTLVIFSLLLFLLIDVLLTQYLSMVNSSKAKDLNSVISKTRISHPVYHHTFKSNYSEIIEHSILDLRWQEDTNSLGFKDNQIREVSLTADEYRIVFIGDSITEGIGYTFDDTFVGIINNSLKERGIEVLNASRVSYSPIIYWRKIKYLIEDVGLDFDELIVLIDMSDIQDEKEIYELDENLNVINKEVSADYLKARLLVTQGDNTLPFTKNANVKDVSIAIRKWITDNTTFVYFITNSIYDIIFDEKTRVPYLYLQKDYTRFSWPYYEKAYNEFAEEGIKKSIHHMDLLLELLNEHNIKTVLKLHNFRYFCTKSFFHRNHLKDSKVCYACGQKKNRARIFNKYYLDSYLKSLMVVIYGKRYFNVLKNSNLNILVLTKFHKKFLTNLGIQKKKIHVLPNLINSYIENTYLPKSDYIVYAGRISEEKGVEELIKSFLKSKFNDINIKIIGNGPLLNSLKKKHKESSVEFMNEISNKEVLEIISKARAVVTGTKLYEGQPMLLCEASSLGIPSFFPRSGGIEEFFPDNYSFSYQQLNYDDLTNKLDYLNDIKIIQNQGYKNKEFISDYLDKENLIKTLDKVINE